MFDLNFNYFKTWKNYRLSWSCNLFYFTGFRCSNWTFS